MKQICLVVLFALVTGCVHLQPRHPLQFDHRYPATALIADFDLLRSALEEAHAGLYDFHPQTEMNADFDRIRSKLTADMTELEFLRLIGELNGTIGCGHTAIVPSLGTRTCLSSTCGLFPGDIRIVSDRMFLFRSYAPGLDTLDGSEIMSINGMPSDELLARFMTVLPSDGFNQTHKYGMLDARMRYYYAAFIDTPAVFEIRLRSADGTDRTVSVPAMAENAMRTDPEYVDPTQDVPDPYSLELAQETSTAILTIRSFVESDRFMPFLADSFKQLRDFGISNLIIDLRGNGGGEDEYGAKLVSYLIEHPFPYYRSLVTRTDRIGFMAHTDITRDDVLEFQSLLQKSDNGGFFVSPEHHPCLSESQPTEPVFHGRVLVLIDGGSFSATSEVAAVLHFHRRAEFAGEETGGRYDGNNSGYMPTLTLPSTGIRAFIPLIQYSVAVDEVPFEGHGIMPDYPIEPSLSDEINGTDRVMMGARAILDRPRENQSVISASEYP